MSNEIVVGSAILSGSEVLIASLAAWHPYVDVYVDATADPRALGSEWRLYAITAGTKTLIATGILNTPTPLQGQRVLSSVPAVGTTLQLWAETNLGATAGPIKGAIVGWDPSVLTPKVTDTADATVSLVPGPSTNVLALPWHPTVTVLIQAPEVARGSRWFINAVIPGFAVNPPVAGALYEDTLPARITCVGGGGAASWIISGSAPAGPTGNVKIAAFGDTGPPFQSITSQFPSGVGAPEGVITGSPGDLYTSASGAGAPASYVKATGVATNTGWRSLDLVYGTPAGVAVVNANETDLAGNAQVPAFSSVWSFTAAGGAAQATAFSAPAIAVASAHKVHVAITASDTAGAECASWDFDVLFRFTGGVLTIQGTVPNAAGVAPDNASAGAAAWRATVDFSGAVPRVRVTGDGAANTRFAGVYQSIPVVSP